MKILLPLIICMLGMVADISAQQIYSEIPAKMIDGEIYFELHGKWIAKDAMTLEQLAEVARINREKFGTPAKKDAKEVVNEPLMRSSDANRNMLDQLTREQKAVLRKLIEAARDN